MNLDLGPDELALRDAIRELCRGRFPIERVREMTAVDREAWKELGEAGVFSMRLPGDEGGAGLGMAEASIVFQELGRALMPGPLVATHMSAGRLDGAATGDAVIGVTESELVEHAPSLDVLVVIAPEEIRLLTGPVRGEPVESLDPLTPIDRVDVSGGEVFERSEERIEQIRVLTAALLSGIASQTAEMSVAYAKEREQFGRPVGSFQAVKHLCADAFVRAEVARAAVDMAAVALDDETLSSGRYVDGASLLAAEYAVANAKACVQVHGGMGFTWEADPHLYLKRAAVLAQRFGGPHALADAVARERVAAP